MNLHGRSQIPAIWPYGREFNYQLQLEPYLKIPLSFDHEACFAEAMALLGDFVTHRNYDQSALDGAAFNAEWKSLALRALDGDESKTEHYDQYGVENPEFRETRIAALCPQTMAMLAEITDISRCERIRFMLLEPGAKIHVHSDSPTRDVHVATNIALNMPVGCDFWMGTNPDGSHHPYSRKLPFEPGDLMIVNIANYHYVENRSLEPRIHIIVHGPLRFTEKELQGLARKQNSTRNLADCARRLAVKRAALGLPLEDPALKADWQNDLVTASFLPPTFRFAIVDDPALPPELREDCLYRVSRASLYPLARDTVLLAEVDSYLRGLAASGADFVGLMFAGSWISDLKEFLAESFVACSRMRADGGAICGHLTNLRDGRLPFLHEQLLFVDLRAWARLGFPKMGKPRSHLVVDFPAYEASAENIHHDYTPLSLHPNPNGAPGAGRSGWGTAILAASLAEGKVARNFPPSLRATKRYAYPLEAEQYAALKEEIRRHLALSADHIFYFSTENLFCMQLPDFRPRHLISVAAGFKPFLLVDQYFSGSPERITLIDRNPHAIAYILGIAQCSTYREIVDFVWEFSQSHQPALPSRLYVEKKVQQLVNGGFGGELDRMLGAIRAFAGAKNLKVVHGNFIDDPDLVLREISAPFLFWHSNSWDFKDTHYEKITPELDANYRKLAAQVAQKMGARLFQRREFYEAIFRGAKGEYRGYFADSAGPGEPFRYDKFQEVSLPARGPTFLEGLKRKIAERIRV